MNIKARRAVFVYWSKYINIYKHKTLYIYEYKYMDICI